MATRSPSDRCQLFFLLQKKKQWYQLILTSLEDLDLGILLPCGFFLLDHLAGVNPISLLGESRV